MLFNIAINVETSTSLIHNISTRTLCLLPLPLSFMINHTLGNIANSNASRSILTPSTTIIVKISMIKATIPSIIIHTGINRCRTAFTTITFTVVVTIATITMIAFNTILIIITSTRLLFLLLLTFIL